MISEKQFINNFSSFWRVLLPLSDDFVRYINKTQHKVVDTPLKSYTNAERRAIINEVGFIIMQEAHRNDRIIERSMININILRKYEEIALRKVKRILSYKSYLYPLLDFELEEAIELAFCTEAFFQKYASRDLWVLNPKFKGCGFIDACEGDIIIGKTLFEIKAGDRPVRMIDLKQILTYCMLDYASSYQYGIENVAIFNPRNGTLFKIGVDELSENISGKSSVDLFSKLIEFVSSSGVSK